MYENSIHEATLTCRIKLINDMVLWGLTHSLSRDPNQKLQHLDSLEGAVRIWYSIFFPSIPPFHFLLSYFSVYAQKVK